MPVDTVTAKIELILRAQETQTPVISSMGAGNKLDASAFRVADIYATKVLAMIWRFRFVRHTLSSSIRSSAPTPLRASASHT